MLTASNYHSKKVRKEIKRLHDDRETSMRTRQLLENNIRDARDTLTRLQHQLDTKSQLERSLSAAHGSLNTNTKLLKVVQNV